MTVGSTNGRCVVRMGLAVVVSMAVLRVVAAEYFVDANRADTTDVIDGKTPETAFKTIQEAVSQSDATIVTVYPGTYTRGDAKTVDSYGCAVCVYIDKEGLVLRSTEGGRDSTFIVGRHAEENGGIGEGAIRCISVSANYVEVHGFTICNGGAPATSGSARLGGGISAPNNFFYATDCVISNCVATRGGAVSFGRYDRCLFTRNKTAGSSTLGSVGQRGYFRNCVVYKNTGPSFGYADGLMNCALVENSGTVLTTGHESGVVAYNCVFEGNGGVGANYYCYSNCVFDVSEDVVKGAAMSACVYGQTDAQFIDPAANDWRVRRGSAAETAGDAALFSKITLSGRPFVDYLGTTVTKTEGTVCAGPCQTVVNPTAQVSVSVTRGGQISVEGAESGDNTVDIGDVVTVTAAETDRRFIGWRVNGEMVQHTGMTYSYTVSGLEDGPVSVEAVYSDAWYVDAVNGSDENDGCTPDKPKKTLAAILSVPGLMAGEVVHAAPGSYDTGTMIFADTETVHSRACVPEDVTLLADEGPENTFIIGSSATADVAADYGLGSNAVRCVRLNSGSKISGFTLTGGRTHKLKAEVSNNQIASAVFGYSHLRSVAENCIITGNVAYSASCTACELVNCRIFDNHATFRRSVGYNISLKGCLIDRNTGNKPLEYYMYVHNCTIGPDNTYPVLAYMRDEDVNDPRVRNTLVLASGSGAVDPDVAASNSVFIAGCGVKESLLTGCIVTNAESVQVDEHYVPVIGANVAVDAGDYGSFNPDVCGDNDLYGRQRVANGCIDVGALEAPWLDRYSHDLGGLGITVTNASPAVVETADGNVSVPEGRLDLEWRNSAGRAFDYVVPVRVTGTGSLTVSLNGATLGTVTSAEGDAILRFRNALAVNGMSFEYVPGEEDEGSAVIGGMKRLIGHIVVIR